jgi:PRTRC genetic system protein E
MVGHSVISISQRRSKSVFVELMPLLKQCTLLITVARIDEELKVNVIPAKDKEGEDEALTTPLSYTGSPEELDRELRQHLASYVDSHLVLGSTLAEAKAEMAERTHGGHRQGGDLRSVRRGQTGSSEAPRPQCTRFVLRA